VSTAHLERPPPSGETMLRVDATSIPGVQRRIRTAEIGGRFGPDA